MGRLSMACSLVSVVVPPPTPNSRSITPSATVGAVVELQEATTIRPTMSIRRTSVTVVGTRPGRRWGRSWPGPVGLAHGPGLAGASPRTVWAIRTPRGRAVGGPPPWRRGTDSQAERSST